jgi:hypothetical protein
MFTPESLLELAAQSEASYLELQKLHPPGTIHDGRNEACGTTCVTGTPCTSRRSTGRVRRLLAVG